MSEAALFPDLALVEVERPTRAAKPTAPIHEAEQFGFDFDDEKAAFELQLRDQYAANRAAQDAYWGPVLCSGQPHVEQSSLGCRVALALRTHVWDATSPQENHCPVLEALGRVNGLHFHTRLRA